MIGRVRREEVQVGQRRLLQPAQYFDGAIHNLVKHKELLFASGMPFGFSAICASLIVFCCAKSPEPEERREEQGAVIAQVTLDNIVFETRIAIVASFWKNGKIVKHGFFAG